MKTYNTHFLRKLLHDKFLSTINIVGLSVGLAVSIMLLLYVTNEFSFDSHFAKFLPELHWNEDTYNLKFSSIRIRSKIIVFFSLLSMFIVMLGLLAIQSFIVLRRTKEIGLRRINGATKLSIVSLLMFDLGKLIFIAGTIDIPVAWWFSVNWLSNYANRTPLGWTVFAVPIIIQCIIATLITWGISRKVLSTNPIEALKNE